MNTFHSSFHTDEVYVHVYVQMRVDVFVWLTAVQSTIIALLTARSSVRVRVVQYQHTVQNRMYRLTALLYKLPLT